MIALSEENVKKIAELARLEVTNDDVAFFQVELARILKAFEDLSAVPVPEDLSGNSRSAITAHDAGLAPEKSSRMRADAPANILSTEIFLSQAPDREGDYVSVPAVLDRST